ncbi:DNA-directed RNA polymerases I, II, and III subunit RPABC3 [Plasmodiophora brassicae]
MSHHNLFEDVFEVLEVDPDGKKFDKVSRLYCRSENYDMELQLDVNSDLFTSGPASKFSLVLARTLNLDGSIDDANYYSYAVNDKPTLADKYEYVMFGKVFKFNTPEGHSSQHSLEAYISFGGLLMSLKGEPRNLQSLDLDQRVYLLMRAV